MTNLLVVLFSCISCWMSAFYVAGHNIQYQERLCKRCKIMEPNTASNCSVDMEYSARTHIEDCSTYTGHQYCYVLKTENNTRTYGCTWPTEDVVSYDANMSSCIKELYRSHLKDLNDTKCACSRSCAVGMFSFVSEGAEEELGEFGPNDGRGEYDSDYVCGSDCFIGIVTTSSILLLAIICYTVYLCTHRKTKRALNESARLNSTTITPSNIPR